MTDSDKLRVLADWFDIYDEKLNGANDNSWVKRPNEVQQDLRRIADLLDKLFPRKEYRETMLHDFD